MIQIDEANSLMTKFLSLKSKAEKTNHKDDIAKFHAHERLCIEKFKYIVLSKTNRYKNFANYEDLNQEGLEVMMKAMNTYKPELGSFFYWAHKYIGTRISRCANLHTTIRFPLKYAKQITPHRETVLPVLIDGSLTSPHEILERREACEVVNKNFKHLTPSQQKVVRCFFGMDGGGSNSITKVCQQLRISRPTCVKTLDQAFGILKRNIQL